MARRRACAARARARRARRPGRRAYQLSFFAAVADTGVAVGTVVALGSAPALAGGAGWLVDRERPGAGVGDGDRPGRRRRRAAGAGRRRGGVSLAGVALASAPARLRDDDADLQAPAARRTPPEDAMALTFGAGALAAVPVLLRVAAWLATSRRPRSSRCSSARCRPRLAYVLFARGLRRLSAAEVSTLTLAEPVTAAALGAAVLGERPGPLAPGRIASCWPASWPWAAASGARTCARASGAAAAASSHELRRRPVVAVAARRHPRRRPGAGRRLREVELAAEHGAARHSVRAALRALAAERLVTLERHRGAHVAVLDGAAARALYELARRSRWRPPGSRCARHDGRLPDAVHRAADALAATCHTPGARWSRLLRATTTRCMRRSWRPPSSPRITEAHAAIGSRDAALPPAGPAPLVVPRPGRGPPAAGRGPRGSRPRGAARAPRHVRGGCCSGTMRADGSDEGADAARRALHRRRRRPWRRTTRARRSSRALQRHRTPSRRARRAPARAARRASATA